MANDSNADRYVIYDTVSKLRAKIYPSSSYIKSSIVSQGTVKPSGRSVIDFTTKRCLVFLQKTCYNFFIILLLLMENYMTIKTDIKLL